MFLRVGGRALSHSFSPAYRVCSLPRALAFTEPIFSHLLALSDSLPDLDFPSPCPCLDKDLVCLTHVIVAVSCVFLTVMTSPFAGFEHR